MAKLKENAERAEIAIVERQAALTLVAELEEQNAKAQLELEEALQQNENLQEDLMGAVVGFCNY